MSERTFEDRMGEAYALVVEHNMAPWDQQLPGYRGLMTDAAMGELLPALQRVGLDPDAIRSAEREACALAVEAEMPATQDMSSTNICEALERAASRIRARSTAKGGEQ